MCIRDRVQIVGSTLTVDHEHAIALDHVAEGAEDRRVRHQTTMVETGRPESTPMSSEDGRTPATMAAPPTTAIIAPLSVHSPGRGRRNRIPAATRAVYG